MIGKVCSILILGYVGLMIAVEMIPEITTGVTESAGYSELDGIVLTAVDLSIWVIPIAAVLAILMYAVHQMTAGGRR